MKNTKNQLKSGLVNPEIEEAFQSSKDASILSSTHILQLFAQFKQ